MQGNRGMYASGKNPKTSTGKWLKFSRPKFVRRFGNEESGATAVEMALLAAPFFLIIGVFFELTIQYFVLTTLKGGVNDLGRQVRTKQLVAPVTPAAVRNVVCNRLPSLFDCTNLTIDVQQIPTWGNVPVPTNPNGSLNTNGMGFAPGPAKSVTVIRAYYEWPTFMPGFLSLGYGGYTPPGSTLLSSTAAVRIEP